MNTRIALNAAVAEAMGWRWVAYDSVPIRGTPNYPEHCRVRMFVPPGAREGADLATGDEPLAYEYCSSQGGFHVPAFATDLNAAFEFVEWLEGNGWRLSLWKDGGPKTPWHADFTRDKPFDLGSAMDDTPAIAICNAGLAALGVPPSQRKR